MSYPLVNIQNSTNYTAKGIVYYASDLCSNDDYSVAPDVSWQASSRGACLITKISAYVETTSGNVEALPYSSSGTSYSQFVVISVGKNKFEVIRRVNGMEDETPLDREEPTENQK